MDRGRDNLTVRGFEVRGFQFDGVPVAGLDIALPCTAGCALAVAHRLSRREARVDVSDGDVRPGVVVEGERA